LILLPNFAIFKKMRLFCHIIAGILGIFIAVNFVEGVIFTGPKFLIPTSEKELENFFSSLVFIGIFLGFLNFFIKPVLNLIALPLQIITFGLFSFIINLFLVWVVDFIFEELDFITFSALIWTTLIIWISTLLILILLPKVKKNL